MSPRVQRHRIGVPGPAGGGITQAQLDTEIDARLLVPFRFFHGKDGVPSTTNLAPDWVELYSDTVTIPAPGIYRFAVTMSALVWRSVDGGSAAVEVRYGSTVMASMSLWSKDYSGTNTELSNLSEPHLITDTRYTTVTTTSANENVALGVFGVGGYIGARTYFNDVLVHGWYQRIG